MNDSNLFLKLNNQLYDLRTPVVMGILNVTPDSFFMRSRFRTDRTLLQQVEQFIKEGATIIDIGGYSTRPQAAPVTADEEIKRISDALEIICKKFPDTPISIDTFRSPVARMAVDHFGVAMINDISGGTLDPMMFETVADLGVAYVLMHTRGTPQNMQTNTDYEDIVSEVLQFLQKKVAQLHLLGVNDVVIDPGFGFAKTMDQNYQLLSKLSYFQEINVPLLAGVSRKSMIYKLLGTDPEGALNGTTAVNMLALMGGASILRVHDVKEAVEAIKIYNEYRKHS
ncbi:MAG: dihydropteroate synthase [Paludibacter sp.]|nr:dihydropteroate synthase [Paludibacter sp.]